jgi:hypothetical protein
MVNAEMRALRGLRGSAPYLMLLDVSSLFLRVCKVPFYFYIARFRS